MGNSHAVLWHSRAFRHPDYRLQVWTATLQEEASEPRCGFSPDGGEMDACLFQTCIFSLPAPPPGPRWAHRYVGIHNTNRSLWLSRNSRWKWSSEFLLVALLHSSYVIGCFYSISIVSLTRSCTCVVHWQREDKPASKTCFFQTIQFLKSAELSLWSLFFNMFPPARLAVL